jgi:hypothetical protein
MGRRPLLLALRLSAGQAQAGPYSPMIGPRCSSRTSSAMIVRDACTPLRFLSVDYCGSQLVVAK